MAKMALRFLSSTYRPLRAGLMSFGVVAFATISTLAQTLEDPKARAALAEFKVVSAAKPEELTPAIDIGMEQFARWTRSHGDSGARRYSTLKQINRDNVKSLQVAWVYHSKDSSTNTRAAAGNIECTPIIVTA
jgi:alcohol dehydrogenase (cytochrome c)